MQFTSLFLVANLCLSSAIQSTKAMDNVKSVSESQKVDEIYTAQVTQAELTMLEFFQRLESKPNTSIFEPTASKSLKCDSEPLTACLKVAGSPTIAICIKAGLENIQEPCAMAIFSAGAAAAMCLWNNCHYA